MANNIIQLVIAAKNEASKVIKEVNKDLSSMQKNTGSGGGIGGGSAGILGGFGTPAAIAATAIALGAVTNEAAKNAASFERLRAGTNALGQQFGLTSSSIISSIDAITQGTLSQDAILKQANQAMLLGVADTAEEFETLAKIAVDRGRKMGIDMEKAFSSIVLGVGRLSPLILDNLGIVIDADNTYKAYAETIGKTADALNDMEKRQALLARLQAEMGDFDASGVNDQLSAWERLSAQFSDLTVKFGNFANNSLGVSAAVGGIADSFGFLNDMIEKTSQRTSETDAIDALIQKHMILKNQIDLEVQAYKDMYGSFSKDAVGTTQQEAEWHAYILELMQQRGAVATSIYKLQQLMLGVGNEITQNEREAAEATAAQAEEALKVAIAQERLNTLVAGLAKEYGFTKAETENWVTELIRAEGSLDAAISKAIALTAQMNAASAAASAISSAMGGAFSALESAAVQAYKNTGGAQEVVDMYAQQRAALNDQLIIANELNLTSEKLPFFVADATMNATGYFDAINEAATATTKASGGAKSLTAEFSNLKSIVSGLFSDMYSDIGGVKMEDFMPREDAPNEAARRIADVMVKGFESPWASYFESEFPILFKEYMGRSGGDIKSAAGLLLKDFQSGLRPELINVDIIKELAKKAFRLDQSTKSMIEQVSRELAAELGISIEEATGYASGAAGGAGLISKEAITKTNSELKFKPQFDMSSTKNDLISAGKTAGLLDDAGQILLTTGVTITSVTIQPGIMPAVELFAGISLGKTGAEVATDIATTVGTVSIATALNFNTMTGNPAAELATAIGTVNIATYLGLPTTDVVETWKNNIIAQAGTIGVPVNVAVPQDLSQIGTAMLPIFQTIYDNIAGPTPAASYAWGLQNNLGTALSDQITSFQMMGLNLGVNMYQGFAQYPLGAVLAGELSRQVDEAQKSFENSGKNAGRKWGEAFLGVVGENVPIELLNILTDLITPEVQARLASEGSR